VTRFSALTHQCAESQTSVLAANPGASAIVLIVSASGQTLGHGLRMISRHRHRQYLKAFSTAASRLSWVGLSGAE
jgi:hypothetical protein